MPDQTPSMPPLPEPFGFHSGFAWMTAHRSECHITLKRKAEPGYEQPLYTAKQVQAVADERVREAQQWRPIETAPKDGTNVLLVNRAGNMATGLWMDSLSGSGWYLRGSSNRPNSFFNGAYGPTHWMPLPPVPTLSLGTSKGST